MSRIGIIGVGYVGRAVYFGFKGKVENIYCYDTNPKAMEFAGFKGGECSSISLLANGSDFIFVCVPTPTDLATGKIDTSIVEIVVEEIVTANPKANIIIKSTVVPGTIDKLLQRFPGSHIVFNPEFLTEKNYITDFINQDHIIIGGKQEVCHLVKEFYYQYFAKHSMNLVSIKTVDAKTAEMLKYVTNCMLAAKVGLCNEFKRICDAAGIKWQEIVSLLKEDDRIGPTHLDVPGPDGQPGFGGKCFPKDLLALVGFAKDLGVDPKVLETIWDENVKYRKDADWLKIEGAVVEKKNDS